LRQRNKILFVLIYIFLIIGCSQTDEETVIKVGSKKFTESVILGEIISQLVVEEEIGVEHSSQLGGTRILWNALVNGEIDIYPEYTGTIIKEILVDNNIENTAQLKSELNKFGISISMPIGFNNTYALGMLKQRAGELKINTISQLKNHPQLKFAFTNEFMDRKDGWPTLRKAYNLPQTNVRGVDHDLAYRGLESGSIDVIDLYSTDAEIEYYDVEILQDDLNHFTNYDAVILYRTNLKNTNPEVVGKLLKLEGSINEKQMISMNSAVKLGGKSENEIAFNFLNNNFGLSTRIKKLSLFDRFAKNTIDHLFLVLISLFAAIIISIPLGIIAYSNRKLGKTILGIVGIIQTIPSLAVLVFMIPLFGIGAAPAIVALFLYSLLPIVRNTYLGMDDISINIRESAEVLGLSKNFILKKIELPLASRSILTGIKTSAIINIGTATLGALIGAGGYGQPILTGIRLDNIQLILEGAIPAALLALAVQWLFDQLEKIIIPKGLQINSF
jgi:osmoprotectant transport system permease protein